jgi:uncharacterized protein
VEDELYYSFLIRRFSSEKEETVTAALEQLRHTKTIALTSFRRDGTPICTPVSVAFDGDRAFFRSWLKAWKTRRLAHTPEVEVAPSTLRGRPTGPAIRARAELLTGDDSRLAARALARTHPLLQRILVPMTHRLMRYRTMHYELVATDQEAVLR